MSTVVVATSAADAEAVEAVKSHHAQLAGALAVQVEALVGAAARGDLPGAEAASDALVRWCDTELIPHALAEEQAMYPAAHQDPRARLLAASGDVSLALILERMHELLGGRELAAGADIVPATDQGGCGGECGCGHRDDGAALPELDARAVPHAIRHATIFGALDSLVAGGGLVLVAPHDPLPLLAQLEQLSPGRFDVDYLQRGPQSWRVRFIRA